MGKLLKILSLIGLTIWGTPSFVGSEVCPSIARSGHPLQMASTVVKPSATEKINGELKTAYMIIMATSKDKSEVETRIKEYTQKNYPWHRDPDNNKYPRLLNSSDIKGLKPGFWIGVVAVSSNRNVITKLAEFLEATGCDSYVRKVKVKQPEDLHLVIVDHTKARNDAVENEYEFGRVVSIEIGQRCPDNKFGCGYIPPARGGAAAEKDGRTAIPYTMLATEGSLIYLTCNIDPDFAEKHDLGQGASVVIPEISRISGFYQFKGAEKEIWRFKQAFCQGFEQGD